MLRLIGDRVELASSHSEARSGDGRKSHRPIIRVGNFIEIPLTHGQVAIADFADFELLDVCTWYHSYACRSRFGYAKGYVGKVHGKYTTVPMHRFLMSPAPDQIVDHINGHTLDNRRSNLRIADASANARNAAVRRTSKSGLKGVAVDPDCYGRWKAYICPNGKKRHLGQFSSPEAAARRYDEEALKLYGAHARLNFPLPTIPTNEQ